VSARAPSPADAAALRAKAEVAHRQASAQGTGGVPVATEVLLHELQVHQIELEMQNDELRRTQAEAEAWREHYFDLYELAPVGYCSLNEAGMLLQANLRLATLLGVPRHSLLQQPLAHYIERIYQDDFYRFCRQLLPRREADPLKTGAAHELPWTQAARQALAGVTQRIEVPLRRSDGSSVWAELVANVAAGEVGSRPGGGAERRRVQRPVLAMAITDISQRKIGQHKLQVALASQQALLKEVHHRVKNNLQVISSLLRLEAGRSSHAPTREVLADMQARIRSMALLHESVYRAGTFASLDLAAYLKQVATQAWRSLQAPGAGVDLRLELDAVQVGLDQATPCGLLLTELLSNALKHGFAAGGSGEVRVTLRREPGAAADLWCLRVSDTGVGLPADFDARQPLSLGLQLVDSLAQQMGGSLVVGPASETGASFAIRFAALQPVATTGMPA
jgi:two-component sensor histidine kinase/PAS domain-containing protein